MVIRDVAADENGFINVVRCLSVLPSMPYHMLLTMTSGAYPWDCDEDDGTGQVIADGARAEIARRERLEMEP